MSDTTASTHKEIEEPLPEPRTEEMSDTTASPHKEIEEPLPEPRMTRSRQESGTTVRRKGSTLAKKNEDAEWKTEKMEVFGQVKDELKTEEGTNTQKRNYIRMRMAATDDGTYMHSFLQLIDLEFREFEIPEEQWGLEIRKYLTGKAREYWGLLLRLGTDMSDWPLILLLVRNNPWRGNYNEYIARFYDIADEAESVTKEELVMFFLAMLPEEIGDKLTRDGTRNFQNWHEAAQALREWAAPLWAWREKRRRILWEIEDAGKTPQR
ncbi:uncharacterized protein EMH_0030400 [Eimeria mitis]|uniref:Uncharacterized protein n=1 Tax=Eimeria mitis TaxID=44415 RepID=U6JR09_9EIME|nr:uncharacterized protein EMH_0030400 [Eimeria mitis]CDJ27291.1 hypothetical protein EMH_0030400 [Eimeria mitis]